MSLAIDHIKLLLTLASNNIVMGQVTDDVLAALGALDLLADLLVDIFNLALKTATVLLLLAVDDLLLALSGANLAAGARAALIIHETFWKGGQGRGGGRQGQGKKGVDMHVVCCGGLACGLGWDSQRSMCERIEGQVRMSRGEVEDSFNTAERSLLSFICFAARPFLVAKTP